MGIKMASVLIRRGADLSKALVHNANQTLAWTDPGDKLVNIYNTYNTILY